MGAIRISRFLKFTSIKGNDPNFEDNFCVYISSTEIDLKSVFIFAWHDYLSSRALKIVFIYRIVQKKMDFLPLGIIR